jgi:hypothetical protein
MGCPHPVGAWLKPPSGWSLRNRAHAGHLILVWKRLAACRAAVLVTGAAVAAGCSGMAARPPAGPDFGPTSAAAHRTTLAATGQRQATLALVSGAATVTVTAAAPPGTLARASTPTDANVRPQFELAADRAQLFLDATGQSGAGAISIQLSPSVTWQLQFSGGSNQTILNLADSKIASIDFTAGASLIQMTLPRPSGTATITLAGGAGQVSVTVPAGIPVRLRLYGGASAATLFGGTHAGVGRGEVLSSPGWAQAANRYDIDAPGGISDIAVTH